MARRLRDKLPTLALEIWTTADDERNGARLDNRCEGGIEVAFTCRLNDPNLPPDSARRRLRVSQFDLGFHIVWVEQHGDGGILGNELMQQFDPFRQRVGCLRRSLRP